MDVSYLFLTPFLYSLLQPSILRPPTSTWMLSKARQYYHYSICPALRSLIVFSIRILGCLEVKNATALLSRNAPRKLPAASAMSTNACPSSTMLSAARHTPLPVDERCFHCALLATINDKCQKRAKAE
jgi:hypothetical protein